MTLGSFIRAKISRSLNRPQLKYSAAEISREHYRLHCSCFKLLKLVINNRINDTKSYHVFAVVLNAC